MRHAAIVVSLLMAAATGAANAQGLPPCRVGLPVKGVLNYPAKIVAVDAAKGSFKIRMDSNGEERWWPADWLSRSCTHQAAGGAAADQAFIGRWSLFVSPVSGYRTDNGRMATTSGARAPPLTIKADGSYVWDTGSGTVTGRWRSLNGSELKAYTKSPAILLLNGYQGMDWQVHHRGVNDRNVDTVTVEGYKIGLNYLATRMP